MNTECMYILKKQSLEDAVEFGKYLDELATKQCEELCPTYVGRAVKDFYVTPDYDGFMRPFKVKKGTYFVWAYGKDYCMYRIRPRGARRCFPYAMNPEIHGDDYRLLAEDVYEFDL